MSGTKDDEIGLENEILMMGMEIILQRLRFLRGARNCVLIDYKVQRFSLPDFDHPGQLTLEDLPQCLRVDLRDRARHLVQERLGWAEDLVTIHLGPNAVLVYLNS